MVEPALVSISAEVAGGILWCPTGPKGAALGHGLVCVGGGEEPGGHRQHGGGEAAVVAAGVAPLVVQAAKRPEAGHRRGPGQHSFAVVRVESDPLPFGV